MRAIKAFARMSQEKIFQKSVEGTLPELLLGSFMSPRISALAAGKHNGFGFDVKGVLSFATTGNKCRVAMEDVAQISGMPSVFYLDGMEAKISSSLIKALGRLRPRRGIAEDFPCYHNDFLDMLEFPRTPPGDLQEDLKQITKIIGGKLQYEKGLLHFKETKGDRFNASMASAGVGQLGILGLLIARGLLQKNSTVIIDEPEANLHPAWQKAMSTVSNGLGDERDQYSPCDPEFPTLSSI